MSFFTVFLLAVALSMDAFAVALASGCAIREIRLRQYVRVSAAFGFFQFFMPVLGWFLGQSVHHFIEAWDHWLAFVLLAWIGGNMLRSGIGGLRKAEPVACPRSDPTAGWNLLLLAVATSIDALAVGLTFAMTDTNAFLPSCLIGGGLCLHFGLRALPGQKAVFAAHAQRLGRSAGRRGAAGHRSEHPARERRLFRRGAFPPPLHVAEEGSAFPHGSGRPMPLRRERAARGPLPGPCRESCRAASRCPIVPEARNPPVPHMDDAVRRAGALRGRR